MRKGNAALAGVLLVLIFEGISVDAAGAVGANVVGNLACGLFTAVRCALFIPYGCRCVSWRSAPCVLERQSNRIEEAADVWESQRSRMTKRNIKAVLFRIVPLSSATNDNTLQHLLLGNG